MSHTIKRIRRILNRPGTMGEVIKDWAWKINRAYSPAVEPTWPVAAADRANVRLIWPDKYQWPESKHYFANLREGLGRLVRIEEGAVPQPKTGAIVVRFVAGGETHDIGLDACDYLDLINEECLARVSCYFKMQYRRGGYGDERIKPGAYVNSSPYFYRYLARLRQIKDRESPLHEVYGRFGLEFAADVRQRAVGMLNAQTEFRYTGSTATVRYGQYLREIARSQVCIDLPSNSDLTFRLVDYLGIGACVIGPPLRVEMHVPLVDGEHIVHCAPDLSNLVELCRRYRDDEQECGRVTRGARDYFDRYLHRDQLAAYYLTHMLESTGLRTRPPREPGRAK